jgi:hypothetical protein
VIAYVSHQTRDSGNHTLAVWEQLSTGQCLVHCAQLTAGSIDVIRRSLNCITSPLVFESYLMSPNPVLMTVPQCSPEGFPVDLRVSQLGIIGRFGGLEQEFTSLDEGMQWVARALSSDYQLKVVIADEEPCAWYLQPVRPLANMPTLATGTISIRSLLGSKRVVYRQNSGRPSVAVADRAINNDFISA